MTYIRLSLALLTLPLLLVSTGCSIDTGDEASPLPTEPAAPAFVSLDLRENPTDVLVGTVSGAPAGSTYVWGATSKEQRRGGSREEFRYVDDCSGGALPFSVAVEVLVTDPDGTQYPRSRTATVCD